MNARKYEDFYYDKIFYEMSDKELERVKEIDCEIYLPEIEKMRKKGESDAWIAACIHDLYYDYLIYEASVLSEKAGISNEDYTLGYNIFMGYATIAGQTKPFSYEDNELRTGVR